MAVSSSLAAGLENPRGLPLVDSYAIGSVGGAGSCWVTAQGPDGVLYFGTDSVLSFDGEKWESHPVGRGSTVRALAFDEQGRLWVGASDEIGYFERTPQGLGAFHSLIHRLPSGHSAISDVWDIVCTDGKVILATSDAVIRWDGHTLQSWRLAGARRIRLFFSKGTVYISHARSGLLRLDADGPKALIPVDGLDSMVVEWLEESNHGILLASVRGLFQHDQRRLLPKANSAEVIFRSGMLSSICRIDPNLLAAGTINNGLVLFDSDGALQRVIGISEGLANQTILHVFTDRDGTLWATSPTHIFRLPALQNVSRFDSTTGLNSEAVTAVNRIGAEHFVATNGGGHVLRPGHEGRPAQFEPQAALLGQTYDAAPLHQGILVSKVGQMQWNDDSEPKSVPRPKGDVLRIFPSAGGVEACFLSTERGLYRQTTRNQFALESIVELPAYVRTLVEDARGDLWLGMPTRGLMRAKRNGPAYELQQGGNGLPAAATAVNVAAAGQAVVALTEQGAFSKPPDVSRFSRLPALDGFQFGAVSKQSRDGIAWVALTRRLSSALHFPLVARLSPAGDAGVQVELHEVPGLARIGAVSTLFADGDAVDPCLWIGGAEGLLRVELNNLKPAVAPRTPLLRARYDEEQAEAVNAAGATLPFAANRLAFDLASTEHARRDTLLFQTRLVGLDPAWWAPTATSRKEYPFLQDGDYRFEVRVVSPAGLASAPSVWAFKILPPWWRTRWAYAGYTILGGLLLLGADRVRISAMRRRNLWLEKEVHARTEELEKANAAKTEFVARVNHDIRNPINGVLGLTHTLEQTPLNDEQRRMTGTIMQCAKFLASLVEEVLDFAEIESGGIKIRSEPFSPQESVAASVATVEPLAAGAGCKLEVRVDPRLPDRLVGDTARLQQILVNFLSNAVKFGAGKPILVTADALHRMANRLVVRVAVRDHGPGLGPEEEQQLFRKFSRGKYAEEKKIKGTGLGLAVCRLLAEHMGGRVGVESAPGFGAEFFTELPFEVDTAGAPSAAPAPIASNALVLVVEDEDYNAISLIAMLRRMGFKVDRCADGLSALEHLRENRYDIVFLDWELPKLNGLEVARRFRAEEPEGRRTLIIATTAYASGDKRQACREAGMDEFVAKPLTPARITFAIRGHSGVFSAATSILVRDEAADPSAGLDLSLFSYLADGDGGLEEKVAGFIASCESELRELAALVEGGQGEDLRCGAHRFLSQCRFIGAARLAGMALELEKLSENPAAPDVRRLFAAMEAEFAAFKNELRSCLDARAATATAPSRSQNG